MASIEPYFYIFDSIGFPNACIGVDTPENFHVYLLCDTEDPRQIFVHKDRNEFNLSSKKDDEDVIRLFFSFSKRLKDCEKSIDIFNMYSNTELHPAHTTKFNGKSVKIDRLRKSALRLYMVFLGSDIILFRLSTKRQDKIDTSEKKILDDRVRAIYSYYESNRGIEDRVRKR